MFWIAIALITISSSYFALQREKLKRGVHSPTLGRGSDKTTQQLRQLQEENKQLEERIRNLEYIVSDKKDYIDIEYEKEQRRLDNQQQKFRY
jgi:cell division protein FtsB